MAINWEAWKFLVGEWTGEGGGDAGQGTGTFSFNFELDQNILVRKNRTLFPATEERAGYVHDDLLIVYLEIVGTTRAIYFDNEGHVIHYEVDFSPDQKTLAFVSDPTPSAPQFRLTYLRAGDDSLTVRFEMASPGQAGAFSVYTEGTARRLSPK